MHIFLGCLMACATETPSTATNSVTAPPTNDTPATPQVVNNATPPPSDLTPSSVGQKQPPSPALPDLKQGLSRSGCDNGPGESGAASYFVGTLNVSGDSVTGEEEWLLYANEKWKTLQGKDCTVRWTLRGTTSEPQACGSCTMGVSLTNAMDMVGSTCPEDMAKGDTNKSIRYDLQLYEDGRLLVYFSRSGKKVGEGYHSNGKMTYATDMSCRWF